MRHATSGSPELVPVPINSTSVVVGLSNLAVIEVERGCPEGRKRQNKLRSVIITKYNRDALGVVTMDLSYPFQKPLAFLVQVLLLVVGRLAVANYHMPDHATVHHPSPRHEQKYFAST